MLSSEENIPKWGESMNKGIVWIITLVIFLDYIQM
jgi:hypothetical protein